MRALVACAVATMAVACATNHPEAEPTRLTIETATHTPSPTPTATPTPSPTPEPTPTPLPTVAAPARASTGGWVAEGGSATLEQLDVWGAEAGWPADAWPSMRRIIAECENRSLNPAAHNTSDPNGGSFGLAQLNGRQHFDGAGEPFEMWMDPVVNLRTALWLYKARGNRFAGGGGWSCADRLGIWP